MYLLCIAQGNDNCMDTLQFLSFIGFTSTAILFCKKSYLLEDISKARVATRRLPSYFFLAGAPFPAAAAGCPGFGRLAPYFERDLRRLSTPAVSKAPRTIV